MRAVAWMGTKRVQLDDYEDPRVVKARDAVLDVKATGICGSDLHLYHNFIPQMKKGDILGHEFMGVVRELGEDVENVSEGDRVVASFPISCGECKPCRAGRYSGCLTTNHGHGAAIYGYSHLYGGVPGGQAEAVRVPFADVGLAKVPDSVSDDQAVLLGDVLPTGYQAALQGGVAEGKTVAVFGAGPVGLAAIQSAKKLLNADHVYAVDRVQGRLDQAKRAGADEVINFEEHKHPDQEILARTDNVGVDVAIDAVGVEASSPHRIASGMEKAVGALMLQTGSLTALRWSAESVAFGGHLSVPGVYGAFPSQNFPWGRIWEKGLNVQGGQTHVQAHLQFLTDQIANGTIDPSFMVTHHAHLEEAPEMYRTFEQEKDTCVKCILHT